MKCPKCKKGTIRSDTFWKEGGPFKKHRRISKHYCNRCDYKDEFILEMTWPEYYSIISEKRESFNEANSDVKFGGIVIKPINR